MKINNLRVINMAWWFKSTPRNLLACFDVRNRSAEQQYIAPREVV
jgi:hypothetical protein